MGHKLVLLALLTCCFATPPPGYVKPPETDQFPPKYQYGYKIEDNKGSAQGKLETRDGVFSAGRYYVQLGDGPKGASQNVQYFTDEWGYHPVVEYSSVGEHSQTSAQFALGEKAVEALKKNTANQFPSSSEDKPVLSTTIRPTTASPPIVLPSIKPVMEVQEPETIVVPLDVNNQNKNQPTPTTDSIQQQPTKQNVPLAQNVIPEHYLIQLGNLPDTRYILRAQENADDMPQAQFLIQMQSPQSNSGHPQFLIPVYQMESETDNGKERLVQNDFNKNTATVAVQPTLEQQNILSDNELNNKNIETEQINTGRDSSEQDQKQISNADEVVSYIQSSQIANEELNNAHAKMQQENLFGNEYLDKNNVAVKSNTANKVELSKIQGESHNNGQYLIEVTQPVISANDHRVTNQNEISLSQNNAYQEDSDAEEEKSLGSIKKDELLSQNVKEESYKNNVDAFSTQNVQIQNTEALFGNTVSEVRYKTSNAYRPRERPKYSEENVNMGSFGGYGTRINVKNSNYVKNNNDVSAALIDRTKNLVTGVDVLNINDAATAPEVQVDEQKVNFEENKNVLTDYTTVQYANNYPISISSISSYLISDLDVNDADSTRATELPQSKTTLIPTAKLNNKNQLPPLHSTKVLVSDDKQQNGRNKLLQILNAEKVPVQENINRFSFAEKPIVVADLEQIQGNGLQSTTEAYEKKSKISELVYSTTQSTIETKTAENEYEATNEPVLITPRPVSNSFLAPITAAVNLQNLKQDLDVSKQENVTPSTYIEIQKSVPYYIGKVEYIEKQRNLENNKDIQVLTTQQLERLKGTNIFGTSINTQLQETFANLQQNANLDVDEEILEEAPKSEALVQTNVKNNIVQTHDQVQEQGQVQQEITVPFEGDQHLVLAQGENLPRVSESVTKLYPIDVRISGENQLAEADKSIENPAQVTQIIEKKIPVHIPQPYPVEVEKIVEKQIKIPVEVTRYVDKPYPVHIPYPQPVAIPVEFERVVETVVKEPYPVKVPVPVEVPIKVPVPQPVQVTKYIEKPIPVEKIIEKPVPVEKIIEKPVPQYIETPFPVPVHVAVPHPIAVPIEVKVPQPFPIEVTKYIEKPYGIPQPYPVSVSKSVPYIQHVPVAVPVTKLIQVPVEVPKFVDRIVDRPFPVYINLQQQQKLTQSPYLYAPKYQTDWKNINCDLNQKKQGKQFEFIGLVPPLKAATDFNIGHQNYKRQARNSFGQNLRIEYGFKPPIIPSVQTDEFGMPLNEEDQK